MDTARAVHVSRGAAALVLDSPHSGTEYPDDFKPACSLPALRNAEDTHVEALWSFATELGATLVQARFPRSYIDANRSLQEVDEALLDAPWPERITPGAKVRHGKGLVWRMLDDGTPIYNRKLSVAEVQSRITRYWQPYHDALDAAIEAAAQHCGHVIHLNCHSMPAVAQAYSTDHPWLVHPDFVLGDRDGTSADPSLTRWIERFLNSRGHTVSVNHPYKGVEIVRRYGRPATLRDSIQIEINKRLYMDETTLQCHAGFDAVQATLKELTRQLLAMSTQRGGLRSRLVYAASDSDCA
jgi:N-formylglutamate deformylase